MCEIRRKFALLLLIATLTASGCADPDPAGSPESGREPGIEVEPLTILVPRIPLSRSAPKREGLRITRTVRKSVWTQAGLEAGDVIESVNGHTTLDEETLWRECGGQFPLEVKIVGTRTSAVGSHRVISIEVTPLIRRRARD